VALVVIVFFAVALVVIVFLMRFIP